MSKQGTTVDGKDKMTKESKILKGNEHTIQLGKYTVLLRFMLQYFSSKTFTNYSAESNGNRLSSPYKLLARSRKQVKTPYQPSDTASNTSISRQSKKSYPVRPHTSLQTNAMSHTFSKLWC
jgi:hypothetical protein